jgi:LL-diaminopimelate aminotransferase
MYTISKNLKRLPPYLFVEIDKAKRAARAAGRDVIDLGVGDPDQPTPAYIIEALQQAAQDPANHRYALDQGMPVLRAAIAQWYRQRFGVTLDADTEILPLIGSKEGLAHVPLAFLNASDVSLIPDPCYPPYKGGTILAGGRPYLVPLRPENGFLPDVKKIPAGVLKKARLVYINYPNNPTGAVADESFYRALVAFARRHKLIVISDLAYSEMAYDGYKPMSILEVPGARDVALEFHSLSKTFNMTGWRVGWACGNASLVGALAKVKSNVDSGIFSAIQVAAATALNRSTDHVGRMCALYQGRRDCLVAGLQALGWQLAAPRATFYLWIRLPKGTLSIPFAESVLRKADIVITPGVGFGPHGEGYVRMALTVPEPRLQEALRRLKRMA